MNKKLAEEVDKKTKLLVDSNKKLKINEQILKQYNKDLEIKIKEEVDKNIKIQKQLFTAEKISSMIEMINNISHQWRQPLSIISTISSGMLLKKEYCSWYYNTPKRTTTVLNLYVRLIIS